MVYMKRREREAQIIAGTVALLRRKGYRATTTRDIAMECGISLGNVTRLFGSLSELKNRAMFVLNDRLIIEYERVSQNQKTEQAVLTLLGDPADSQYQDMMQLWREITVLARDEQGLRDVYQYALHSWAQSLARYLEEQRTSGVLTFQDSANDMSWRLIAFVSGLDLLQEMEVFPATEEALRTEIMRFIERELMHYNKL